VIELGIFFHQYQLWGWANMSVPGFQKYFLPFLEIVKDKKEHTINELVERLANYFNLSDEDKNELVPSGRDTRHANRVKWTRTYFKKALIIESVGKAKVKITQRGLDVLSQKPKNIDIKFLEQFEDFKAFRTVTKTGGDETKNKHEEEEVVKTPEEILEDSYNNLRQELAKELLDKVKTCSPKFFESLVVDLLVAMGYGGSRKDAGQAVGQSGDGGVDGIIKEDKLGLDVVYIQAKRWDNNVGRPVVQAFGGSLMGKRANKGVMITTSKFSQDAKDYVKNIEKKIVLIDGEELSQFMIDHDIGVYETANYVVKKMNTDYFEELS
jgi:restriction system protein